MHLRAAAASTALARLALQIFCSGKPKAYGECDLERVHMPAHVEAFVIAEPPFIAMISSRRYRETTGTAEAWFLRRDNQDRAIMCGAPHGRRRDERISEHDVSGPSFVTGGSVDLVLALAIGRLVPIKATFQDSLTFRTTPQPDLGLKLYPDGRHEVIFNGPGQIIFDEYRHRHGHQEKLTEVCDLSFERAFGGNTR